MVFLANASNFVRYFLLSMHYPDATTANMVTNCIGTSFFLSILGGFISDSLFHKIHNLHPLFYHRVAARYPQFRPASCARPSRSQAAILYTGLYVIAAGSSYFNWFFFSLCFGGLLSCTMIWVEENKGWNWNFTITIIALIQNWKASPEERVLENQYAVSAINSDGVDVRSHNKYKFLDKALTDSTISAAQVKETRTFIGLLPIFASTILMNCCIALIQTHSVVQGTAMNRKINNFKIPVQSLGILPLSVMLASIPLYERFQRRAQSSAKSHIFQPLWRIGLGLALASGPHKNATLSFFWLGWQYLFLGVSDMLTLGGMLEFFHSEAPDSMRSISTSLSWCSTSMGYFLSSVLVSIANSVSGRFGKEWLGGADANHSRLDLFYTLLCILNTLNVLNYIDWARKY
ncbi:protein NRT1/ PTR FAMILY 4.2-like [Pyrus ussuriensis x Pyrus communis]|uniref:Protein NRT1/ PTR FAMILY 4.2-like n=1 Tax=Pyrus ussuriensis x Pyrus communis TaxID=2448454 RepID=A0A5N5IDQ6_9ROSA|nr:protein NRT1/ PTR FAMILY 4.2-like [Pyrus ussuriensis x Pyrus communis]